MKKNKEKGREFEITITREFLDILAKSGSNLLPLDYKIGDRVRVWIEGLK